MDSVPAVFTGFVIVLAAMGLYFLPSIVACRRRHHQAVAIFLLNLFAGWMFWGWVLAIVWAATAVRRPNVIVAATADTPNSSPPHRPFLEAAAEVPIKKLRRPNW